MILQNIGIGNALESGKWVKVLGWAGADQAKVMVMEAIKRAQAAP